MICCTLLLQHVPRNNTLLEKRAWGSQTSSKISKKRIPLPLKELLLKYINLWTWRMRFKCKTKLFWALVNDFVLLQVERIGYHASVVVWAGNNENELGLVGNWYGTKDNFSAYQSDYLSLYRQTIYQQVHTVLPKNTVFVVSGLKFTKKCVSNKNGIPMRNSAFKPLQWDQWDTEEWLHQPKSVKSQIWRPPRLQLWSRRMEPLLLPTKRTLRVGIWYDNLIVVKSKIVPP